jgi:PIN domain nuclease of toxin-antitoxin system
VKVLIDTNIWLFMANRPERLGQRTHKLLSSTRNEIWLSSLSILELHQLERKGKWRSSVDVRTWVERSLKAMPLREAPVTFAVAIEAGTFELVTGDPIDRLIVATAREMRIPLVTADQVIIASGCVEVVPND